MQVVKARVRNLPRGQIPNSVREEGSVENFCFSSQQFSVPGGVGGPSPPRSKRRSQSKPRTKALLPSPNGNSRVSAPGSPLLSQLDTDAQLDPLQLGHLPRLGFEELVAALPFLRWPSGFMDLETFLLLLGALWRRRTRLPFPRVGWVLEAGGGAGGLVLLRRHLAMRGGPRRGYLDRISRTAEGFETQLRRFYLHIPLAGAKCASRKAIFQLFPFIKVSFAKIFPFEEPKNVKDF